MNSLPPLGKTKRTALWFSLLMGAALTVPPCDADYPTYPVNHSQATGTSGYKLTPRDAGAHAPSLPARSGKVGSPTDAGNTHTFPVPIKRTVPVLEKEPPPERRSTFGAFQSKPFAVKRSQDQDVEESVSGETMRTSPGAEPEGDLPAAEKQAESKNAPSSGSSTVRLRAVVTHSEEMAPLPPAQRPGRIHHAEVNVAGGSRAKRFKIPDWIAGVWQRSEAKEISRKQLPSGKELKAVGSGVARVKDVFGTYRDRGGQVWQAFNPAKASGQIDRGPNMDYHRVHGYDLVITGPKSLVVEVQATHTVVSKANRQIQRVYQDEELNTYTLLPDGKLKTDSSVKVFDMNGKPFLLTRSVSTQTRVPPKDWPPRSGSPARGE